MNKLLFLGLILFMFSCKSETKSINNSTVIKVEQYDDGSENAEVVEYSYKETLPAYTFPEVKNVDETKSTVFSATLESDLDKKKNVVYAASLLMAWDEIETTIGGKLYDFGSPELERMYNSTTHQNVLLPNEYNTSVEIVGDIITANAEFKKALPFKFPLTKHSEKLKFEKDIVSSFGFKGKSGMAYIVYYNNDNDFCIAINPKDSHHLIYLMKSEKYEKTFKDNFDKIAEKREKQKESEVKKWKLSYDYKDVTEIPIIEFNLENYFDDIENTLFYKSSLDTFKVLKAYQRTGFILNEKGAIVESEAIMVADGVESVMEAEAIPPTPKKLIFDKKFMVFLKREKAKNPYFALQITDAELLTK